LLVLKKYSGLMKRDNTASVSRIYRPETQFWRLALELIVVIILVLLLFGSFPIFPYSRGWGYRGSGVLGTILLIVVILWLLQIV
jgi:hypothetical protein